MSHGRSVLLGTESRPDGGQGHFVRLAELGEVLIGIKSGPPGLVSQMRIRHTTDPTPPASHPAHADRKTQRPCRWRWQFAGQGGEAHELMIFYKKCFEAQKVQTGHNVPTHVLLPLQRKLLKNRVRRPAPNRDAEMAMPICRSLFLHSKFRAELLAD